MGARPPITVVLLAAGASTRLGRPKQLLVWHGSPLLRHLAEEALRSRADSVIVVIPPEPPEIGESLKGLRVTPVVNRRPDRGLSSSIRVGMESLPAGTGGVVLMLCDMPRVTASHLDNLISQQAKTGVSIVASGYGDTSGAPVLFMLPHFQALRSLTGDTGAKDVLRRHASDVVTLPLEGGEIDIDTSDDAQTYVK